MKKYLDYLIDHPGIGLQLLLEGEGGKTTGRIIDLLEYDELGITVVHRSGSNARLVEGYPWSAVRGLVTTLSPETFLKA